jgi:hypothetical protein
MQEVMGMPIIGLLEKGEKVKKAKKSAITYLVDYPEHLMLPVPLVSSPVMKEVAKMPIIGLLGKRW